MSVARSMRYFIPRSNRLVKAYYAAIRRSGKGPSMATLSATRATCVSYPPPAPQTGLQNNFCSSFSRSLAPRLATSRSGDSLEVSMGSGAEWRHAGSCTHIARSCDPLIE